MNINGLNFPVKRYRFAIPIGKKNTRNPLHNKDTHELKLKNWKKVFRTNVNQKQAGTAILMSGKVNSYQNGRDRHCIIVGGSTKQDDMTALSTLHKIYIINTIGSKRRNRPSNYSW